MKYDIKTPEATTKTTMNRMNSEKMLEIPSVRRLLVDRKILRPTSSAKRSKKSVEPTERARLNMTIDV